MKKKAKPQREQKENTAVLRNIREIIRKRFPDPQKPVVVAIGGPGGTGKTTLAGQLSAELGNCPILSLDHYKYSRIYRKMANVLGPHPDANNMRLVHEHLKKIKQGKLFWYKKYDGEKGISIHPARFKPQKFNIVEGEISTYPDFYELIDFSIFVGSRYRTQWSTRINRDVNERNHTYRKALHTFLHSNLKEFIIYGRKTKKTADLCLHCHFDRTITIEGSKG